MYYSSFADSSVPWNEMCSLYSNSDQEYTNSIYVSQLVVEEGAHKKFT